MNPIACLADNLSPTTRHTTLMETFEKVSKGLPALEAVRARRKIIEALASSVAVFYNEWDRQNPGDIDWINPAASIPKDEHMMVRATLAFATASRDECDWFFYRLKSLTHPEYSNTEGGDVDSELQFKLMVMAHQAKNFVAPHDLPVPSNAFEAGTIRGLQYDQYAVLVAHAGGGQQISDTVFALAEQEDWDGVWDKAWAANADRFQDCLKTLSTQDQERDWVDLTNHAKTAIEDFWGALVSVSRYFHVPLEDMREKLVSTICQASIDAYRPDNPVLLQALMTWQVIRGTALAGFAPKAEATLQAWTALEPLAQDGQLDIADLKDRLTLFEEQKVLRGKAPRGEVEEGFQVWEAKILRERLQISLDKPAMTPTRRRTL